MRRTCACLGLLVAAIPVIPAIAYGQVPPAAPTQAPAARKQATRFSVIGIPVNALGVGLGLSNEQKIKIKAIEEKFRADQKALSSAPAAPAAPANSSAPGAQPTNPNFVKQRELRRKADEDIDAILTSEQKARIPSFMMRDVAGLIFSGIPIEVYGDLNLTEEQNAKIAQVIKETMVIPKDKFQGLDPAARKRTIADIKAATHEKTMAVLTPAQRAIVEKWEKTHSASKASVP